MLDRMDARRNHPEAGYFLVRLLDYLIIHFLPRPWAREKKRKHKRSHEDFYLWFCPWSDRFSEGIGALGSAALHSLLASEEARRGSAIGCMYTSCEARGGQMSVRSTTMYRHKAELHFAPSKNICRTRTCVSSVVRRTRAARNTLTPSNGGEHTCVRRLPSQAPAHHRLSPG